jgi:PAS domain-containing protein
MIGAARAARLVARGWTDRRGTLATAPDAAWEEQFRILFDRSTDPIIVVDPDDHRILRVNRACEVLFDRPRERSSAGVFSFCSARGRGTARA